MVHLLFEGLAQVGIDKATHQWVATLDVDVDVGRVSSSVAFCSRHFEQLYPEAETADLYGVGVDVHAKEAVFYDGLLFVEEGFLYALAFFYSGFVFKEAAIVIGYNEFVIDDFYVVISKAFTFCPVKFWGRFYSNYLIEGRYQKVAGSYSGITDVQTIDNFIGFLRSSILS